MKKFFLAALVLIASGCSSSINDMSSKMEESNKLMKENIAVMKTSKEAIQANTQAVKRSTYAMATVNAGMTQVHPLLPPLMFILIIAVLFTPVILLMRSSKKLMKDMDRK